MFPFFIPTSLVNNMAKAPLVAGKIMVLPKQRRTLDSLKEHSRVRETYWLPSEANSVILLFNRVGGRRGACLFPLYALVLLDCDFLK